MPDPRLPLGVFCLVIRLCFTDVADFLNRKINQSRILIRPTFYINIIDTLLLLTKVPISLCQTKGMLPVSDPYPWSLNVFSYQIAVDFSKM